MPDTMEEKQERVFTTMNKLNRFFLLLCVLMIAACKDDNETNNTDFFPEVQVNTNINLRLPQYSNLSLITGHVYLTEGYRGIVVYRTISDEFVAYDRTCPHNTSQACSYVSLDSNNIYLKCGQYNPSWKPCCDSKFDAATGSYNSGPAKRGLKPYFVRRDGDMIYISSIPF